MGEELRTLWVGAGVVERLQVIAGDLASGPTRCHSASFAEVFCALPRMVEGLEFFVLRGVLVSFLSRLIQHTFPRQSDLLLRNLHRVSQAGPGELSSVFLCALRRVEALRGSRYADDRVDRAVAYIRTHAVRRRLSVEEVAAQVGLSRWHLERLLRQGTGQRFKAHLEEVRMMRAMQLLADSTLTIKEIAAYLGYANGSAFSRAFRHALNQSPKAWRRGHNIG